MKNMFSNMFYNGNPIAFHPYPSVVMERFIQCYYTTKQEDEIFQLKQELLKWFNDSGINCYDDNKIVFEIEIGVNKIFIGFKDGTFSIGFAFRHLK